LSKIHDNCQKTISKFQEECNKQLGIEVEHAKTYQTAIISEKKKHYIGWTGVGGKEPDIVGMEGDKNDRPKSSWKLVSLRYKDLAQAQIHDIISWMPETKSTPYFLGVT